MSGVSAAPLKSVPLALLEPLAAGEYLAASSPAEFIAPNSSLKTVARIGFVQSGSVRVNFEHRRHHADTSVALVVRLRAGIETTIIESLDSSGNYILSSSDIDVLNGDDLIFKHKVNYMSNMANRSYFRNLEIRTDGQNLFPNFKDTTRFIWGNA